MGDEERFTPVKSEILITAMFMVCRITTTQAIMRIASLPRLDRDKGRFIVHHLVQKSELSDYIYLQTNGCVDLLHDGPLVLVNLLP